MGIELVRLTKTRPERFGKVVNTVELPISNHSVIEVHTKESPSTNNEHHPAANKTHMTMVFRLVLNIYANIGLNKVAVGIRILPFLKRKMYQRLGHVIILVLVLGMDLRVVVQLMV